MTITAPQFADLDLSDPDEQMRVTNNGKTDIEWRGVGARSYTIKPGQSEFVPFHIIVRNLGDPRSDYRKTETFITPSGARGVIPERRAELVRLSVWYGLYHGKVNDLPKVAPKVTVTTLNDIKIDFPIFDPKGQSYRYQTDNTQMIDPRMEFDRLRRQNEATEAKMNAILERLAADDPEGGEAPEDSHPGDVTFPHQYTPPGKYPSLSQDELLEVLSLLTQDLIDLRSDFSSLSAQHNAQFFRVFLDSNGESVAGRNRLAEAETLQLTSEKVECEVNIAATEDLCALARTILELRRSSGKS